jgi:hypothetical protein
MLDGYTSKKPFMSYNIGRFGIDQFLHSCLISNDQNQKKKKSCNMSHYPAFGLKKKKNINHYPT